MTETPHGDWNQVGAAFTALGEKIQAHFSGLAPKTPAAESAAPFEELGRSLDDALTAFRNAVGDPDIAAAAKSAADDLMAALRTEVDSAGDTASGALDQVTSKIDEIANAGKDTGGETVVEDVVVEKELPPGDAPTAN